MPITGALVAETDEPKDAVLEALHRVYVESLVEAHRNSDRFATVNDVLEFEQALGVVADSDLDQLQKWHVAASALNRRPDLVLEPGSSVDAPEPGSFIDGFVSLVGSPVLRYLREEAGMADLDELPIDLAGGLRSGLVDFAGSVGQLRHPERPDEPAPLTRQAWERFHELVLTPLHDNLQEFLTNQVPPSSGVPARKPFELDDPVAKPGCNDEIVDPVGKTRTIVSRFWSKRPVGDFASYVDPTSWPHLGSKYWKSMTIKPGTLKRTATGYGATFDEVVDLPTGTIRAELAVTYTATDDYALTTYCETGADDDAVTRDAGYVFATSRTQPPNPGYRTLVYSTKTIEFAPDLDDLNEFTDLACDNGWVDMMIRMAIPEDRSATTERRSSSQASEAGETTGTYSSPELDAFFGTARSVIDENLEVLKSTLGATIDGTLGTRHLEPVLSAFDGWVDAVDAAAKAWRRTIADLSDSWGTR